MPNRIIKESIKTSKTINAMTDFQFRAWTYLITYVDDYGRGSADPELLKGFVFPRRKRVSESDIAKTLAELAGMGCINLYEIDGESYFYFPNWSEHQRIQTKKSKFPEPLHNSIRAFTVGHGGSPPESQSELELKSESEPESESQSNARRRDAVGLEEYCFSPEIQAKITEWLEYKKERKENYKPMGLKNLLAQIQNTLSEFTEQQVIFAISESMACNYKGIIWDKAKQQSQKSQPQQNVTGIEKLRQQMQQEQRNTAADIVYTDGGVLLD